MATRDSGKKGNMENSSSKTGKSQAGAGKTSHSSKTGNSKTTGEKGMGMQRKEK